MKNKFNKLVIFSLLILLFNQCEEAEIPTKEYPLLLMGDVITSQDGVLFSAIISVPGNQEVVSYGFVWGIESFPEIQVDDFIEMTAELTNESFSRQINSGLVDGQIYFVRPFIKTDELLVYGTLSTFESEGSKVPVILDFEPKSGSLNKQIVITGENFGVSVKRNKVKFGAVVAVIDSASETKLYVRIPEFFETTKVNITVESADKIAVSEGLFNMFFPWTKINASSTPLIRSSQSFVLGNNAYIIESNIFRGKVGFKFNAESKTITEFDLPESSSLSIVFTIGEKGYVLFDDGFYEYDPNTNTWTQKADFPDKDQSRNSLFSFGFQGFGAIGSFNENKNFWAYDPASDSWRRLADVPNNSNRSFNSFYFTVNNKGYFGISNRALNDKSFWEYNPVTNRWVDKKPYLKILLFHPMVINGEVFVGVSLNKIGAFEFWVKYDDVNDEWIEFQNHPDILNILSSFGIGSKGYVVTARQSFGTDLWEFDPDNN